MSLSFQRSLVLDKRQHVDVLFLKAGRLARGYNLNMTCFLRVRWWRSWSAVWPWRTAETCSLCSSTTTAQRRPSKVARWWPTCSPSSRGNRSSCLSAAWRTLVSLCLSNPPHLWSADCRRVRTKPTLPGSCTSNSTASWTPTVFLKTAWSSPSCSSR